jgi:hypothetical protein
MKVRSHRCAPFCEDCGQIFPEFFMVHDWVWRLIGNGDGVLCLPCLDERARVRQQRSLSIKDFKKRPQINQLIFFGYRLAVRSLMKEIGEENWHSETAVRSLVKEIGEENWRSETEEW